MAAVTHTQSRAAPQHPRFGPQHHELSGVGSAAAQHAPPALAFCPLDTEPLSPANSPVLQHSSTHSFTEHAAPPGGPFVPPGPVLVHHSSHGRADTLPQRGTDPQPHCGAGHALQHSSSHVRGEVLQHHSSSHTSTSLPPHPSARSCASAGSLPGTPPPPPALQQPSETPPTPPGSWPQEEGGFGGPVSEEELQLRGEVVRMREVVEEGQAELRRMRAALAEAAAAGCPGSEGLEAEAARTAAAHLAEAERMAAGLKAEADALRRSCAELRARCGPHAAPGRAGGLARRRAEAEQRRAALRRTVRVLDSVIRGGAVAEGHCPDSPGEAAAAEQAALAARRAHLAHLGRRRKDLQLLCEVQRAMRWGSGPAGGRP
eukprot:TRINITY_DN23259_c0_g1_i1.p1 TRINITY_DN23259_c0_g1~~TRINITY_DN23259_c0_g1_i1.p1  ORF type:complete len:396 (+),score=122.93 TRINITY_DN23259_c0_g1_i1:69-1190(+)